MADENIQDVSGIPANDALAQLELQRKLKMADMLRQAQMPEGQMVSGHYVAPSWTQYAANAMNKYYGGKAEEQAMKNYGAYQKSKEQKQVEALRGFVEGMQPKATTTTQDNFVTQPLSQGMNVPTSPFGTSAQVVPTSPYGTQNMQGDMTTNQPTQTTAYTPRTQQELINNFYNYAQKSGNPEMASKFAMNQFEQAIKPQEITWEDLGDKKVAISKTTGQPIPNIDPMPINAKPGELAKVAFDYFKFNNPSASDIYHGNITKRGQNLVNAREQEKLDPYHLFNTSPANISTKPLTNNKGWTLHTDAQGNQAYVSPDGKNYEEAK
jgi:hypothetical protein